jgi:CheY-like chemotaxis protein
MSNRKGNLLEMMETSSRSLLGVINDILDISKIEAGKFSIVRTPGNLREIINMVHGLLKFNADEKDIEFTLQIDKDVPEALMVDSLRLNQILMNLLSNSIKFTSHGYVTLKVLVLQKLNEKVKLKFAVEDSGIGIPADRLSKIFESFEQAEEDTASRYGGTGLGLAIVKKLVELKGGELSVISKEGKGSEFSFTNWFNITVNPQAKPAVRNGKSLDKFINVKVLVAEDNLINQFMLSKILKDWNIAVDVVDNGNSVLERLRVNDYDLILMDTHMPGLNGYQTSKRIRMDFEEPKRSVPIISLSAAAFEHEHQEAIAAGMNDFLPKPYEPHQLHERMLKLLNSDISKKVV